EFRRSYVLEQERAAQLEAAYAAERARVGDLERADRARARLLEILTHELLNPVAAIRAATLVLQRRWDALPEETRREMLQRVSGQSEQLSHVAADASATLQEQAPALSVEPRSVPVRRLLDDAVAGAAFLEDRLSLRVEDDAVEASVRADPPRVQQVFANLLTNAARHGSPGGAVELAAEAVDGDWIRFSVKNPGPGIPEDQREQLFEAFTRLRDDRPGSGLGLFICRRIVEAHGGRISADGGPGETVFAFTLPRESDRR
ncbi:MAG TPA: HAMP domain-containing sensor histidine kinase, partial [Actinomycetota bacterium]|nr:HAMP domain-containing sensor histidine kinase [Actinomycetota bacterium]